MATIEVKMDCVFVIPRVPNFITIVDGCKLPLDALTKDSLEAIAAAWRLELINQADVLRKRHENE